MKRWPLFVLSLAVAPLAWGDFTMTLIHTNDLHAHVEPVKIKGVELGGYARLGTLIKSIKSRSKNPLLVNAGDTFQGTLYFNVYHGLVDAAVMDHLGYRAAAVGNHEFDLGPKALGDFARLATFPILAANLDVRAEPALKDFIKPFVIIHMKEEDEEEREKKEQEVDKSQEIEGMEGEKIGIVGCVTPDLLSISSPGPNVKMKPLLESVQAAIDQCLAMECDKVILLSHTGYREELELAKKLKGIDVIVGGHSHTFLGDTALPGDMKGAGPYPTVMKNADGDTCLVVQSWEWGKVLGKLEITFDEKGRIEKWSKDQPIAVTSVISEDPEIKAMIAAFRKPIEELITKEVGETRTEIPRNGPGKQGPMADMITDSMLEATKGMGSVVAFMNAGGVRSALNAGKITYGDAISVQPFNNSLVCLDLTGAEIETALSSGILYVSSGSSFSLVGGKATSIIIAGQPLDRSKTYTCTLNSFVASGGDGLDVVKNAKGRRTDTGLLDIDAFLNYIKANSPLDLKSQGRIKGE